MWTSKNRGRYDRSKLRYPSDLTDDEWGLVEPLIPPGNEYPHALRHVPQTSTHSFVRRLRRNISLLQLHLAKHSGHKVHDRPEQRGFADAVTAHDSYNLASAQRKAHVPHNMGLAIVSVNSLKRKRCQGKPPERWNCP